MKNKQQKKRAFDRRIKERRTNSEPIADNRRTGYERRRVDRRKKQ